MKITEQELDKSVQEKLNQLDSAKTEESGTYVSFNGSCFVSKPVKDLTSTEVFDMDEIYNLSKHLYKSEDNYISSYDTEMLDKNVTGYATSALLNTLSGSFQFKTENKIIKTKIYDNCILSLEESGLLHKINKFDVSIQSELDILKIIKTNFVYKNFNIYSIVDFELYNDGVLIATESNGIYYLSFSSTEYIMKVQETDVEQIKLLNDNKTLIILKSCTINNVVTYDLLEDTKINVFNQLGKINQIAQSIYTDSKEFYILGKSFSSMSVDNILHGWKTDSANVDYNNIDKEIFKKTLSSGYQSKFIRSDSSSIYIVGVKDSKLFILSYSRSSLMSNPIELIFDIETINYDDIKDFKIINGRFYVSLNSKLLVLDENFNLIENYYLSGKLGFDFIEITKNGIYAIDGRNCYLFKIPAKLYQKVTNIYIDNDPSCNNIDIYIKMPAKDQIIFLNSETNQQFSPYFHMVINGDVHVIKLSNIEYKNIIMKIGTYEEDRISGLVIHKNRIFYK